MPYFQYEGTTLNYKTYGKGDQILFLFHGYGQDAQVFEKLCLSIGDNYLCFSFDLFFHGKSELSAFHNPLEKAFLKKLFSKFLSENQIGKFGVLGYSLGSKLSLSCVELFPEKINRIILLAPDSMRPNLWYRFATGNFIGRKIFKLTTNNSRFLNNLLIIANRFKVVPSKLLSFTISQTKTVSQRQKIYQTWMAFRMLNFKIKTLGKFVTNQKIPLLIFIGKRDLIVSPKRIGKLKKHFAELNIILLDCGHTNLINSVTTYFRELKK